MTTMPSRKKATPGDQAKGCGCLLLVVLLIIGGCNSLFGGDDLPAPVPVSTAVTSPDVTSAPIRQADDLDDDGIEDRYDDDADGDGVSAACDRDDQDPSKGKRKPNPKPKPEPETHEPAPVFDAHPGGFCGTTGAVGVASNGRTYTCRGGHWRR